jgi:hypothetical protein
MNLIKSLIKFMKQLIFNYKLSFLNNYDYVIEIYFLNYEDYYLDF